MSSEALVIDAAGGETSEPRACQEVATITEGSMNREFHGAAYVIKNSTSHYWIYDSEDTSRTNCEWHRGGPNGSWESPPDIVKPNSSFNFHVWDPKNHNEFNGVVAYKKLEKEDVKIKFLWGIAYGSANMFDTNITYGDSLDVDFEIHKTWSTGDHVWDAEVHYEIKSK